MHTKETVWGFDIGKGSLGEAVRVGNEFKHVLSMEIDADFAEIKTAAATRRAWRTREAHKAREKWLEKCLSDADIEILGRRKVDIVDGTWKLVSRGDGRLEREFPADGENVCYNSIALRCKLLLGEKLESWQVFKALNSAIQNRGYDAQIPWGDEDGKSSETKRSGKSDSAKKSGEDESYAERLALFEREFDKLLAEVENREKYDFPCFFKAAKMGLWSPENPDKVGIRIDNTAEKAKGYVVPRNAVIAEFRALVNAAAKQYPKLKGKADFIMFGKAEEAYASYKPELRRKFGLRRGADSDWTALGQKTPRFDNRIIGKCKLIPRLNVCKIKPLKECKTEDDFLPHTITLALKLLNLRFFRGAGIDSLSFDEFLRAFEIARQNKFALNKTNLKKFFKTIGAEIMDENQSSVEQPREGGRAAYSRPAMRLLRDLIFSGKSPAEFYASRICKIENTDKNRGLVAEDLAFIKLMGDIPWNGIFVPDVDTFNFANIRESERADKINKLIGSQNDPIVRHRLAFFYERIKLLESKFGAPDKIVLEFVRDDFLGSKAKKEMSQGIKKRFEEKKKLAEELDSQRAEFGNKYASKKMLLKFELYKKQRGRCVYTDNALPLSELENLEVEHIFPRSRGGADAMYNYVLTDENTNKQKGDKTPFEWLSSDKTKWESYCDRVRSLTQSLGAKRCKLLVSPNAEELMQKYTALAETAWISKLAQKICCIHFGFQFGGLKGEKKVWTVSGNTTAMIRGRYGLNRLLHNEEISEDLPLLDRIVKEKNFEEKNRDNKKHHALDAMCICFAPTSNAKKALSHKNILPEEIAKNPESDDARNFFAKYLEEVVPTKVAIKKPELEQTIYSKRVIAGRETIVKKCNVRDLAYKGQNPKYDFDTLTKRIKDIINPVSKRVIEDFAKTEPTEAEWEDWCKYEAAIPSKNGSPTRLLRVLCKTKDDAERFKDLSKDGCGAYRKSKSHKGQFIWKDNKGNYLVAPVYIYSSKQKVYAELKNNPKCMGICDFFKTGCLVKISNEVVDEKKNRLWLKAGFYNLNSIAKEKRVYLTDVNGQEHKKIPLQHLMNAGMKRVETNTI